jgi:hypothetical protein
VHALLRGGVEHHDAEVGERRQDGEAPPVIRKRNIANFYATNAGDLRRRAQRGVRGGKLVQLNMRASQRSIRNCQRVAHHVERGHGARLMRGAYYDSPDEIGNRIVYDYVLFQIKNIFVSAHDLGIHASDSRDRRQHRGIISQVMRTSKRQPFYGILVYHIVTPA